MLDAERMWMHQTEIRHSLHRSVTGIVQCHSGDLEETSNREPRERGFGVRLEQHQETPGRPKGTSRKTLGRKWGDFRNAWGETKGTSYRDLHSDYLQHGWYCFADT